MANPDKLPIVEVFGPTIQGEGAMIGRQTMFVRSAHCDYLCSKCDSLFAVIPEQYKPIVKMMTAQELWEEVDKIRGHCKWITLSGGNPALWDFSKFIEIARENRVQIAVETQGSIFKDWLTDVDCLTVSPKGPGMGILPKESIPAVTEFMERVYVARHTGNKFGNEYELAFKVPVFGELDLDFAEEVRKINPWIPLYLSVGNPSPPGQDTFVSMASLRSNLLAYMEMLVESVLRRPNLADAIILPQLHVLIYGNKQGV